MVTCHACSRNEESRVDLYLVDTNNSSTKWRRFILGKTRISCLCNVWISSMFPVHSRRVVVVVGGQHLALLLVVVDLSWEDKSMDHKHVLNQTFNSPKQPVWSNYFGVCACVYFMLKIYFLISCAVVRPRRGTRLSGS